MPGVKNTYNCRGEMNFKELKLEGQILHDNILDTSWECCLLERFTRAHELSNLCDENIGHLLISPLKKMKTAESVAICEHHLNTVAHSTNCSVVMHHAHVKDSESTLQFLVAFRVGEVAPSISGVNVTDLGSAKKLCSLWWRVKNVVVQLSKSYSFNFLHTSILGSCGAATIIRSI